MPKDKQERQDKEEDKKFENEEDKEEDIYIDKDSDGEPTGKEDRLEKRTETVKGYMFSWFSKNV